MGKDIKLTLFQLSLLMADLEQKIKEHTDVILIIESDSSKAIFQDAINERLDVLKTLKEQWDK